MSEWKETTLGEISLKITDGAHHSPKEFDCGKPMFSVKNMRDQGFDYNGVKTISDEDFVKLVNSGCQPQKDDILIAKDGSVMKHVFRVKGDIDYVLLSSIAIVRPDKSKVNPSYLVYAIKDPSTTDLILNNFVGGSGVPRIVLKDFKKVDLTIPSLDTQKSIATILSSLDDKIDLLHRQNITLEKMAETLFRQWFVEEAKEDWEEISLYDAIELVGGGTPKTTVNEYWDGNIKWLSGGDIAGNHKNFVVSSEKSITELGLKNSSAKLLPKFSTVISARGTVGKYCMLSEPMTFSQSNYGILPKFKNCFFFTYLLLAHSVDELQSAAYGSVFDTITTNTFKGLTITLPEEEYIIRFNESMEPYFSKILTNQTQIRTLSALRNTLLPKLMSGVVTIEC